MLSDTIKWIVSSVYINQNEEGTYLGYHSEQQRHVVPALAKHWLLIFLASWGAKSFLAPFPQADPTSLRSQATGRSLVWHKSVVILIEGKAIRGAFKTKLQNMNIFLDNYF